MVCSAVHVPFVTLEYSPVALAARRMLWNLTLLELMTFGSLLPAVPDCGVILRGPWLSVCLQ